MKFKTKKSILKLYLLLAIVASFVLSVWRILLLKEHCNPYDMSFQDGALPELELFEYTLLAVVAVLSTCIFFVRKTKFGLFGARASTTSVSICAISGFITATVGVLALVRYSDEIFDFSDETAMPYHIFYVISLAFMFISALYLLGRASISLKNSPSIGTLSLALPCFAIAYLVTLYFDSELPLLDFNRVTAEMAFIAALMFSLSEARLATNQGSYPFRFAASLATIVCVCAHIVPLLALTAFWEISMNLSLLTEISLAGILVYALFAAFNAIRTLEEA